MDRGADEKDAITVAADAADAAANANEENTKNINKNTTIHVEEEMNAAQMLHIQTTRELRLKKHLPRHESALFKRGKESIVVAFLAVVGCSESERRFRGAPRRKRK